MGDRIILATVIAVILIVPGILSIIKSEIMYRSSATYVSPKKPSRAAKKRFRISGYVSACLGIVLVVIEQLASLRLSFIKMVSTNDDV
ncbi:hypothetical protein [Paenibacillus lignilyticus]|uniref:DUF6199 domain-containing protein n=1 Tax=Paenibacillus lignilyticus TaxID=1172615 RepID=A0ABS5C9D5_9BACL|nr:hypothetical protein [Paenibacillus lignilyticus]MBP3962611.1 hypothetical protein [Paenibacillus lignilyticus]